jgi:4-aminobutyrate aminotransferase-like enzyme
MLDCLSGYCVHNVGHNHPHVVSELVAELQNQSTAMIQSNVEQKAGTRQCHHDQIRIGQSHAVRPALLSSRGERRTADSG